MKEKKTRTRKKRKNILKGEEGKMMWKRQMRKNKQDYGRRINEDTGKEE
jgi:hypothetical protein